MKDINYYLDKAIELHDLPSDRALSEKLGASGPVVYSWRKYKAMPNEDHMIALAEMVGEKPEIALAELGFWKFAAKKNHKAASVFARLADHLTKTIHMLSIGFFLLFGAGVLHDSSAGTMRQHNAQVIDLNINYATVFRRFFTHLLRYILHKKRLVIQ